MTAASRRVRDSLAQLDDVYRDGVDASTEVGRVLEFALEQTRTRCRDLANEATQVRAMYPGLARAFEWAAADLANAMVNCVKESS